MLGRSDELATGRGFLERLDRGPASLLIEGEAGIGKTTLWREIVGLAAARGWRTLVSRPAESETGLSLAGVTDLLAGIDDRALDGLPGPQREALAIALLRAAPATGRPPARRAVLAALSTLLASLAAERPVLVAVDDLQWLDGPSQAALEYALRRVDGRPIGFLAAVRTGGRRGVEPGLARALREAGAERIALGPLSVAAVHDLVAERTGRAFARPILVRIQAAARGNPFYALEIARAVAERGEPPAGAALPVPADLSELVAARIARLPAATRSALLAAAAQSRPSVAPDERPLLEPAERAGLVAVAGGEVAFAHPLFAAAVYQSAGGAERRAVHRGLAGRSADPEERARHLALAADEPSVEVAGALDAAADRARSRGAPEAAAELLAMAIGLTPPDRPSDRCHRLLAAAQDRFHAGDLRGARAHAEQVVAEVPGGPLRGRALRVLAEICHHGDGFAEAIPLLEAAIPELTGTDDLISVLVNLAYAHVMVGDSAAARPHAHAARDLAADGRAGGWTAVALAATALVDLYLDEPLDRAALERALALEDHDLQIAMPLRPSLIAALALHLGDDLVGAATLLRDLRRRSTERGEESDLPLVLAHLAMFERRAGRLEPALAVAEEGVRIARMLDSRVGLALVLGERAYVRATLGDLDGARQDAARAWATSGSPTASLAELWAAWALAFAELSAGNPAATRELLGPIASAVEARGAGDPVTSTYLPDMVEALVMLGDLDRATRLAGWLEATGRTHERGSVLGAAARARALLAAARGDLVAARAAADEAVAAFERVEMPLELGRALLVAGQVARRARRKRQARALCEQAIAAFERIGARVWAERARAELARTGLHHARPGALTPTEARVAELAAAGLTNRLIAERAFLSPKTVEANLARVYAKLGIGSRAELGRTMADRGRSRGPASLAETGPAE